MWGILLATVFVFASYATGFSHTFAEAVSGGTVILTLWLIPGLGYGAARSTREVQIARIVVFAGNFVLHISMTFGSFGAAVWDPWLTSLAVTMIAGTVIVRCYQKARLALA